MRINKIRVENFRAIHSVRMDDIGDMVMIAGPNGCGKSCILDSIRLLKSVYGGYLPNEWQQWFGEFQINFQRNPEQMKTILRDKSRSSFVEVAFILHKDEKEYLRSRASRLVEDVVWKTVVPGMNDPWLRARGVLAAELRAHKPTVDQKTQQLLPSFLQQIENETHVGQLEITPTGEAKTQNNLLLEILFSSYEPGKIGLLDYHGSHRNYGREQLGGINLNLESEEEKQRQHLLYNYAQKYTNIKSEMAADFVREALKEKSGIEFTERFISLSNTLQELFKTFFPGKTFLGPIPTSEGALEFPVELNGGGKHDINELSSGEKEVLFGYLRLRNSAPRYSVILLDEPELHLNPALVRGLPQFYRQHLGADLDNQIWLVTHSDAFLREAVGTPGIDVFHMQYYQGGQIDSQLRAVKADDEAEAVIIELVGDLAAYRPGAKVVFFEGHESEFDLKMVSRLFPEVEKVVNFVSGGNRERVERLHRVLDQAVNAGRVPVKIYSVVDKDTGDGPGETAYRRHFSWDVYHIENYLLEPKYILEAMRQIGVYKDSLSDEEAISKKLNEIARECISELVAHFLREMINEVMVRQIALNANHQAEDLGAEMHRVAIRSADQIRTKLQTDIGVDILRKEASGYRATLEKSLDSDDWKKHFRGRDVLKRFAGEFCNGIRYEMFRDLIISTMVNDSFQPEGMKKVIQRIVEE
ncbi:MAG: ATP-binding protein [Nitrosomonas sp.]|nr:MAG: ATP-binding protein [Nitrosomonas sp.]